MNLNNALEHSILFNALFALGVFDSMEILFGMVFKRAHPYDRVHNGCIFPSFFLDFSTMILSQFPGKPKGRWMTRRFQWCLRCLLDDFSSKLKQTISNTKDWCHTNIMFSYYLETKQIRRKQKINLITVETCITCIYFISSVQSTMLNQDLHYIFKFFGRPKHNSSHQLQF